MPSFLRYTMKRNETVDIIKGLGIFLVVLAHSGFPLSQTVYLFHMPVFLMASGYCFNLRHAQSAHRGRGPGAAA